MGKVRNCEIHAVVDNMDKQDVYAKNMDKFKQARNLNFYFESLWILYAMIEDRTSAFLYYIGFTHSTKRSSVTGTKNIKEEIRSLFQMTGKNYNYRLNTLSGKFDRMQQLIQWAQGQEEPSSDFQKMLKEKLLALSGNTNFITAVEYLNVEWREKRNQLTHALFNKNADAVSEELKELVDKGYSATRSIDSAVKKLRASPNIRKKFNIQ